MMGRLGIVGPGRAGKLLAVAAARAGWRVVGVTGGSDDAVESIRERIAGLRRVASPEQLAADVETLVLTVPDDSIAPVADALAASEVLGERHRVVHLAGSRGLEPLRRVALAGARIAACHPAMTIPTGAWDPDLFVGVAWGVTAHEADRGWADELVVSLGGDPFPIPEDRRALYHAGLTVGSNAVGAAVAAARQLLLAARVEHPERFLAGLIDASVANVLASGASALTGPVVRGDVGTLATHLDAIDIDVLSVSYRRLMQAVLAQASTGMDTSRSSAVSALLEGADSATHRGENRADEARR